MSNSNNQAGRHPTLAFDFHYAYFWPFYKPIIGGLLKLRSDIAFIFSTPHSHVNPSISLEFVTHEFDGIDAKLIDQDELKGLRDLDVYVSAKIEPVDSQAKKKICISHNMPAKWKYPPKGSLDFYDQFFLTCPAQKDQMIEAFGFHGFVPANENFLKEIGLPKLDSVFRHKKTVPSLHKTAPQAALPNKVTRILYAPTWDPGLSLDAMGIEIVRTLADMQDVELSVKLHPGSLVPSTHHDFNFLAGGRNWKKIMDELSLSHQFRFVTEEDDANELINSDLLVTDVSSLTHEYVLFGKPVLFFDPSLYFRKVSRKLYRGFGNRAFSADQLTLDPLINGRSDRPRLFRDAASLCTLVRQAIENPGAHVLELDERFIPYNLGNAGKVAASEVLCED